MSKDRSPRRRPGRTTTRIAASKPKRRRWPLVLAFLGLVLAAGATYAVVRIPWPAVAEVRVRGTDVLDPVALARLSGLEGQSMLRLPLAQARERLLEVPQIKKVTFGRSWPAAVTIRIDEREPWGFWSVGGRDYPVDDEGVVLAGGAPSSLFARIVEPDSDRVMGPGDRVDPDAIALADRIFRESPRFLGRGVRELEYRPGIGVTAVFEGGLKATFGDERAYEYKVAVLSKLLDQLSSRGVTPHAVDLRFGERVTYD